MSENANGLQASLASLLLLMLATIVGFKYGQAHHATFGGSVMYSLGVLILLPLALIAVSLPIIWFVGSVQRHRISAARASSADLLVTWLGLSDADELTDEDCAAWCKAAGRVGVAEAQRWSDYGLPFTMIPIARQMGILLPQVADIVVMLREAGIDTGARRELGSVLFNGEPIDGGFYLHWQVLPHKEITQTLAAKVAEEAMQGRRASYRAMTDAYVELACRHYGEKWYRAVGHRRPRLPAM